MMRTRKSLKSALSSLFLILGSLANASLALPIDQAITAIADRLVAEQVKGGVYVGSWPEESGFTGAIAAGMVEAYKATGQSTYRASAELGGNYILRQSQGNLYDNEALALTCLSAIAKDPASNTWRSAVGHFYAAIQNDLEGGTHAYISLYAGLDPSTVVIYLANHVVAAHYVDAKDKKIWRQGLISWLSHVDDSCVFPVMALGAATWALAQTGPLDQTLIDPFGNGASYWNMRRLEDLPELLLSHQVANGQPGAGGFYWRFDHGDGGSGESQSSGYTEDTIFGTLGLIAASRANPGLNELNLASAILSAREALLDGVSSAGTIWELLSHEGATYYLYAGEMLTVLGELESFYSQESDVEASVVGSAVLGKGRPALTCMRSRWGDVELNRVGRAYVADLRFQSATESIEYAPRVQ